MSNSESELSESQMQRMAAIFKALSNPHRLRIYKNMAALCQNTVLTSPEEEVQNCQREYAEKLGLAASTVSHHFKELRQAGLIHMDRKGKTVRFWIDQDAADLLRDFFK